MSTTTMTRSSRNRRVHPVSLSNIDSAGLRDRAVLVRLEDGTAVFLVGADAVVRAPGGQWNVTADARIEHCEVGARPSWNLFDHRSPVARILRLEA